MIFSFNKVLNFDKIVILRSFQQSMNELYDINHFKPEHVPFFDQVILRQLKDAASAVALGEKCMSLAEMFSVELKLTVDTLKAWFNKILKLKFFDVDYNKKDDWRKKSPLTSDTACTICAFPIDPYAENRWFNHVVNSEHPFLRNIYSPSQVKVMGIDDIDGYKESLYRLLNIFTDFEDAVQDGEPSEEVMNFIREDLCDIYDNFNSLREDVEKVSLPEKPFSRKQELFRNKMVAFLYSNLIPFCVTEKVKGILILKKIIWNIISILPDTKCIHHSHIAENIYGYAHIFCNERVRENYFKVPVIAHNLFRFDVFFSSKRFKG